MGLGSILSTAANVVGGASGFGPVIGALGSLAGGLIGKSGQDKANETNLQIARETNESNERLMDKANEWNLQMWNKQNEYNTPAAQVERMKEAGLNPLFYGLDGSSAGALQSATAQMMPASVQNSYAALGQGVSDAALKAAQIANINADTENKESQKPLTDEQARQLKLLNDQKAKVMGAETESQLASLYRQTFEDKSYAAAWKVMAEDENLPKRLQDSLFASIDEPIQRIANMKMERMNLNQDTKLKYEQAKNYAKQIALGYAGLENNLAVAKIQAMTAKYAADKGFEGVTKQVDKSVEGFILDILDEAGLKDGAINKIKELLAPKDNKPWYHFW